MSGSTVVYTTVIGGYETLAEQEVAAGSQTRWVCFTDDPSLRSETWEIRLIQPRWPMDPVRSARDVKIRVDRYLPDARHVLWMDNSVHLLTHPESLLEAWLAESPLAVPQHSYRACVLEEFAEVTVLGLDDPVRVFEQQAHYGATDPDVFAEPVLWTGLLARRLEPATLAFGELWMEHVLRYSRRDQLSINHALRQTGLPHTVVCLDNFESPHHRWPVLGWRMPDERRRHFSPTFIPSEIAQAQADSQLRDVRQDLERHREKVTELAAAQAGLAELIEGLGGGDRAVAELERLRASDRQLAELLDSKSVRWTSQLRRVAHAGRHLGRSQRPT